MSPDVASGGKKNILIAVLRTGCALSKSPLRGARYAESHFLRITGLFQMLIAA
jgi:hypothetical protein